MLLSLYNVLFVFSVTFAFSNKSTAYSCVPTGINNYDMKGNVIPGLPSVLFTGEV